MEEQKKQKIKNNSLTAEFIPYEQALELKELGFDEPCFATYQKGAIGSQKSFEYDLDYHTKVQMSSNIIPINSEYTEESKWISAPLYPQCFRWFREKHGHAGFIELIEPEYGGDYGYAIYYKLNHLSVDHWNKGFKTYEEAELACLEKLIEIVKIN